MSRDLVLHVGIHRDNIDTARDRINRVGATILDGDGWEAWGEAPGTDVNDDDTLHLQVLLGHDRLGIRARRLTAALRDADLLVTMRADSQAGTIAVVTDTADWSQVVRLWHQEAPMGAARQVAR